MMGKAEGWHAQPWTFPPGTIVADESIKGFHADATDGSVGKVSWASYALGESYLVVTLSHHLRKSHRVVPASGVVQIDHSRRRVSLRLTRADIEALPEHHEPTAPLDSSTVAAFERAIATLPRSGDMS